MRPLARRQGCSVTQSSAHPELETIPAHGPHMGTSLDPQKNPASFWITDLPLSRRQVRREGAVPCARGAHVPSVVALETRAAIHRTLGLIRHTVRAPYNTSSGRDSECLV